LDTILFIVTHCASVWNELGMRQGHVDVPLSHASYMMAELLAKRLQIDHDGFLFWRQGGLQIMRRKGGDNQIIHFGSAK
jgi:hypothetical protein